MSNTDVVYYGRGAGVAKCGPFANEVTAWEHLMGTNGEPVQGATVWCERVVAPREDSIDDAVQRRLHG